MNTLNDSKQEQSSITNDKTRRMRCEISNPSMWEGGTRRLYQTQRRTICLQTPSWLIISHCGMKFTRSPCEGGLLGIEDQTRIPNSPLHPPPAHSLRDLNVFSTQLTFVKQLLLFIKRPASTTPTKLYCLRQTPKHELCVWSFRLNSPYFNTSPGLKFQFNYFILIDEIKQSIIRSQF